MDLWLAVPQTEKNMLVTVPERPAYEKYGCLRENA